jgi:hypothetical protein
MVLPMAEMVGWLRKGVGELIRQAGLQLMDLMMQEEVRVLVGERSQRRVERTATRWGSERGYCVVMASALSRTDPPILSKSDPGILSMPAPRCVMTTMEHHDAEGPEEAM